MTAFEQLQKNRQRADLAAAACIHLFPPVPFSRSVRHFAFFTWVRFVARPLPFGRGVTAMETPVNRKEDPKIEKHFDRELLRL